LEGGKNRLKGPLFSLKGGKKKEEREKNRRRGREKHGMGKAEEKWLLSNSSLGGIGEQREEARKREQRAAERQGREPHRNELSTFPNAANLESEPDDLQAGGEEIN